VAARDPTHLLHSSLLMNRRILTPVLGGATLTAAVVLVVLIATARHAASPSAPNAASGWPSAATTGVPAGIVLHPSGSITVSTTGAVIDSRDISGCVDIRANNVTIRNTRISGGRGCFLQVRIEAGFSGALIEDTEIDGQNSPGSADDGAAIGFSGFTALRVNLHNNVDGVALGGPFPTVIRDSWIHDLTRTAASHNQDIVSNSDTAGITITHNRLDNQLNAVGAVDLFGDFGPIQNVRVDNNLLNGGGFSVYGGCDPLKRFGGQCQNISFTNNHVMRTPEPGAFFPLGGYFGVLTSFNGRDVAVGGDDPGYRAAHGLRWSGNVWDDTGTPIGP